MSRAASSAPAGTGRSTPRADPPTRREPAGRPAEPAATGRYISRADRPTRREPAGRPAESGGTGRYISRADRPTRREPAGRPAEPGGTGRYPSRADRPTRREPAAAGSAGSAVAAGSVAGSGRPREARLVRSRFEALGTYGELLLDGRPDALGTAVRILRAELDAIDLACSRFRADSELMAVNAAAGRTVQVSDLLAEAVGVALTAAAQTGGDVDPTLWAALVAAGYDADFAALPADGPAVLPAPSRPGAWREIELDRARGTLRTPTALDLGATAKALAVDRAAAAIAAATGAGVLVNVGGDLAAAGPVPPAGWPVRLTDDTARTSVTRPGRQGPVVRMHGGGLATSSTAVRRWRRAGALLHHVLDPRTGLPAEPVWRTVTVTAATCVDANTASTAAIVRGRGSPEWLSALGLPSRLVDAGGAVHRVAGWPPDDDRSGTDEGREVAG